MIYYLPDPNTLTALLPHLLFSNDLQNLQHKSWAPMLDDDDEDRHGGGGVDAPQVEELQSIRLRQ